MTGPLSQDKTGKRSTSSRNGCTHHPHDDNDNKQISNKIIGAINRHHESDSTDDNNKHNVDNVVKRPTLKLSGCGKQTLHSRGGGRFHHRQQQQKRRRRRSQTTNKRFAKDSISSKNDDSTAQQSKKRKHGFYEHRWKLLPIPSFQTDPELDHLVRQTIMDDTSSSSSSSRSCDSEHEDDCPNNKEKTASTNLASATKATSPISAKTNDNANTKESTLPWSTSNDNQKKRAAQTSLNKQRSGCLPIPSFDWNDRDKMKYQSHDDKSDDDCDARKNDFLPVKTPILSTHTNANKSASPVTNGPLTYCTTGITASTRTTAANTATAVPSPKPSHAQPQQTNQAIPTTSSIACTTTTPTKWIVPSENTMINDNSTATATSRIKVAIDEIFRETKDKTKSTFKQFCHSLKIKMGIPKLDNASKQMIKRRLVQLMNSGSNRHNSSNSNNSICTGNDQGIGNDNCKKNDPLSTSNASTLTLNHPNIPLSQKLKDKTQQASAGHDTSTMISSKCLKKIKQTHDRTKTTKLTSKNDPEATKSEELLLHQKNLEATLPEELSGTNIVPIDDSNEGNPEESNLDSSGAQNVTIHTIESDQSNHLVDKESGRSSSTESKMTLALLPNGTCDNDTMHETVRKDSTNQNDSQKRRRSSPIKGKILNNDAIVLNPKDPETLLSKTTSENQGEQNQTKHIFRLDDWILLATIDQLYMLQGKLQKTTVNAFCKVIDDTIKTISDGQAQKIDKTQKWLVKRRLDDLVKNNVKTSHLYDTTPTTATITTTTTTAPIKAMDVHTGNNNIYKPTGSSKLQDAKKFSKYRSDLKTPKHSNRSLQSAGNGDMKETIGGSLSNCHDLATIDPSRVVPSPQRFQDIEQTESTSNGALHKGIHGHFDVKSHIDSDAILVDTVAKDCNSTNENESRRSADASIYGDNSSIRRNCDVTNAHRSIPMEIVILDEETESGGKNVLTSQASNGRLLRERGEPNAKSNRENQTCAKNKAANTMFAPNVGVASDWICSDSSLMEAGSQSCRRRTEHLSNKQKKNEEASVNSSIGGTSKSYQGGTWNGRQRGRPSGPARNRGRKGVCALCTTCPCQHFLTGGQEDNLNQLDFTKTMSRSDVAIEKALIRRVQKLEKSSEHYEDQAEIVRRKLKKVRRDIWKKREKKKQLREDARKKRGERHSRFLPDAKESDDNVKASHVLPEELVKRAQWKMFVSNAANFQPTLTQLFGSRPKENKESNDLKKSENTELVPMREEAGSSASVGSSYEQNDQSDESYIAGPTEPISDSIQRVEWKNGSCMADNSNDSHGSLERGSIWGALTKPSSGVDDCSSFDEENSIASRRSKKRKFDSSWDRLFTDCNDDSPEDTGRIDDLLNLFKDYSTNMPKSQEPMMLSNPMEISLSMLTQDRKSLAKKMHNEISKETDQLSGLEIACPRWKENIAFALYQRNRQAVQEALTNVQRSQKRMLEKKKKILEAWGRQNLALQLFEKALTLSLNRIRDDAAQLSSNVEPCQDGDRQILDTNGGYLTPAANVNSGEEDNSTVAEVDEWNPQTFNEETIFDSVDDAGNDSASLRDSREEDASETMITEDSLSKLLSYT